MHIRSMFVVVVIVFFLFFLLNKNTTIMQEKILHIKRTVITANEILLRDYKSFKVFVN